MYAVDQYSANVQNLVNILHEQKTANRLRETDSELVTPTQQNTISNLVYFFYTYFCPPIYAKTHVSCVSPGGKR